MRAWFDAVCLLGVALLLLCVVQAGVCPTMRCRRCLTTAWPLTSATGKQRTRWGSCMQEANVSHLLGAEAREGDGQQQGRCRTTAGQLDSCRFSVGPGTADDDQSGHILPACFPLVPLVVPDTYLRLRLLPLCLRPLLLFAARVCAAELGHNCEYAEKYFWQFVSQRSSWLSSAQAALLDYDSPSSAFAARPTEVSSSHRHTDTHVASTPAVPGHSAGQPDSSSAEGAAGLAPAGAAAQVPDRYLQALVRYLLLAESGCEAAAENAAWMLLHAQGASGPRAVGLATHLLYRCARLEARWHATAAA